MATKVKPVSRRPEEGNQGVLGLRLFRKGYRDVLELEVGYKDPCSRQVAWVPLANLCPDCTTPAIEYCPDRREAFNLHDSTCPSAVHELLRL